VPKHDNHNYTVGYGRPPRQTQFKKGRSGNPAGRPPGAPNLATALARVLKERVVVNEQGRRRTITKFEAALTQLANKAASGEARALTLLLLNLLPVVESGLMAHAASVETLPEADRQVMTRILDRLHRFAKGDHDHGSDSPRI
jgi:hypothetical protein